MYITDNSIQLLLYEFDKLHINNNHQNHQNSILKWPNNVGIHILDQSKIQPINRNGDLISIHHVTISLPCVKTDYLYENENNVNS